MLELQMLWVWTRTQLARRGEPGRGELMRAEGDRGDGILIWVIMVSLLAAAAIIVVAIIVAKAKSTATNTATQ